MSKFISIDDIVLAACMGDNDILQQKKMKYLFWAKKIWNDDLNLNAVKMPKRMIIGINKKTNTLDLPCDSVGVSGVSTIGHYGEFYPVFRNERLHNDIVGIAAKKDCSCECGNDLCNMVKGYEAVTEYIDSEMPNGDTQTFTCVTRKGYDAYGNYFEEKQYPQREYTDGTWTGTILHTEKIELCKLELTDNGCVKECKENYDKVVSCGMYKNCNSIYLDNKVGDSCIVKQGIEGALYEWESGYGFSRCGGYFNNSYNITEDGNRLIFPHNFGHSKVLVRYYADVQLKDIKVPAIATEAFIVGIKYWETLIDDDKQNLNQNYSAKYSRLKWALMQELNKYRIAEMRMIMTPPVYIPRFDPSYNNNNYNLF